MKHVGPPVALERIATPQFPEGSMSLTGVGIACSIGEDEHGNMIQCVVVAMNHDWAAVAGELLTKHSMNIDGIRGVILTQAPWDKRK